MSSEGRILFFREGGFRIPTRVIYEYEGKCCFPTVHSVSKGSSILLKHLGSGVCVLIRMVAGE